MSVLARTQLGNSLPDDGDASIRGADRRYGEERPFGASHKHARNILGRAARRCCPQITPAGVAGAVTFSVTCVELSTVAALITNDGSLELNVVPATKPVPVNTTLVVTPSPTTVGATVVTVAVGTRSATAPNATPLETLADPNNAKPRTTNIVFRITKHLTRSFKKDNNEVGPASGRRSTPVIKCATHHSTKRID